MDTTPARIFLRPIGSPLTIGTSGLALGSFVQSGYELGWVPGGQTVEVGLILLGVPFVLQLLATIFTYLARDGAAGAALGLLATTWLAIALVDIASGRPSTSAALGLLLLASGATLALSAAAVSASKPLPGGVFALASLRFVLAGIYQLSAVNVWQQVAGIAGLVLSAGAAYCVLAFELEGLWHRPVLPTLRRSKSMTGDGIGAQLDGIAREAGVRHTT